MLRGRVADEKSYTQLLKKTTSKHLAAQLMQFHFISFHLSPQKQATEYTF